VVSGSRETSFVNNLSERAAPSRPGDPAGESSSGRITDEDVARARAQIGIRTPERVPKWNVIPDASSISHFAFGYGDDNPLWHDPEYGKRTRWRGQIAPPLYLHSTGINETPPFQSQKMKDLFRGLFRGVGKYFSSTTWEWFRPVYPGDLVFEDGRTTIDVAERPSSFSGGRVVVETYRTTYVERTGEIFGVNHESYVNAERTGSQQTGRHSGIERQHYNSEDIEKIDHDYATELRQGAEERWWENVLIGDTLQPVVKGPLTVFDVISHHMASGWGAYGIGPLRYNWRKRQSMPGFFTPDNFGVPDVVQRMHWDSDWAEAVGLPAPYDVGQMRVQWLSHLITNWMGDDAWLWKLTLDLRNFNFVGDTQWCTGEVTEKYAIGDHRVVELGVRATSQRGSVTTSGRAVVILPSKESGPVLLPMPDANLRRHGAELISERTRLRHEQLAHDHGGLCEGR